MWWRCMQRFRDGRKTSIYTSGNIMLSQLAVRSPGPDSTQKCPLRTAYFRELRGQTGFAAFGLALWFRLARPAQSSGVVRLHLPERAGTNSGVSHGWANRAAAERITRT